MASMASVAVDPADPLALHKLVFLNKVQTLKMYLTPYKQRQAIDEKQSPQQQQHSGNNFEEKGHYNKKDATQQNRHPAINSLDNHLVTPLHLAVMLNRKDMVSILLEAGANPVARSGSGWTPRQEAASLGDRELIEILTRYQRKEFSGSFKTKAMSLVKQLSEDLDQFYFQLQWEFQSWVPFVSGLCPNDTYHIWKKGNCVRMDTSLVGFENMKWLRGHISIIFRVDPMSGPELVIIDRVKKITQRLATSADDEQQQAQEPTDEEIEREVSVCFNSDITSTNVPTSAIKFHRAKTGLWGYRTDKVEKVGEYECAVWKMDGVEFRTRVRTEHLKDEYGKPLELHKAPAVRATKGHHHHHHHGAHGHGRADLALIGNRGGRQKQQPRRPIQPLLATFTESEPIKDSDAKGDTTALEDPSNGPLSITASSEPVEKNDVNGIDQSKHQRVMAPKKHARSTGTISDDAFFETALEEAEEELGNEDDPDTADDMEFVNPKAIYRKSLPPPPPPTITFEEYFDQSKQGELHLGRPLEQKESRKTFGATLWMYDGSNSSNVSSSASGTLHDNKSTASIAASSITSLGSNSNKTIVPQFPLTIERIIPLLEVIGMDNNRLVGKLKEFLEFQLPPGFPIRANIPVYPSLSADVTFVNYDAQRIINDDMFDVPGESEGFMEGLVVRSMGQDDT